MRKLSLSLLALFPVSLFAASACTPGVDCSTVKPYAEVTAFQNSCNACHSSALTGADRLGAPSDINYDTHAAAKTELEESIEVMLEGEMPPSDGPPITDEEKQVLLTWLQCGTPE